MYCFAQAIRSPCSSITSFTLCVLSFLSEDVIDCTIIYAVGFFFFSGESFIDYLCVSSTHHLWQAFAGWLGNDLSMQSVATVIRSLLPP